MKVILDTNFLIYCVKHRMDFVEKISELISEGYDLVVPDKVIVELNKLKTQTKKYSDRDACNLAIQLVEAKKIKIIKTIGENTDSAIIELANKDKKNIVATLDREMRFILGRVILISRGNKLLLTR